MRHLLASLGVAAVIACSISLAGAATDSEKRAVLETYADIAEAGYADSLMTAKALQDAVRMLIASPNEKTMRTAREAWLASRVPYQQTEAYRFGNKIVDEWEGKVNAWPLDEGLIDYVSRNYAGAQSRNPLYNANVIANEKVVLGAKTVDASKPTRDPRAMRCRSPSSIAATATGSCRSTWGMRYRALRQHVGSIAFDSAGKVIAATSPVGGAVVFWNDEDGTCLGAIGLPDVCGLGALAAPGAFAVTSGRGDIYRYMRTAGGLCDCPPRLAPGLGTTTFRACLCVVTGMPKTVPDAGV